MFTADCLSCESDTLNCQGPGRDMVETSPGHGRFETAVRPDGCCSPVVCNAGPIPFKKSSDREHLFFPISPLP